MGRYSEQLRDPRWQRKRLEIMQRDGFACIACGSTIKTLNVHHIQYVAGHAPWEYPDSELHTLCQDCHADEHGKGPEAMRAAAEKALRDEYQRIYDANPEIVPLLDRLEALRASLLDADKDTGAVCAEIRAVEAQLRDLRFPRYRIEAARKMRRRG